MCDTSWDQFVKSISACTVHGQERGKSSGYGYEDDNEYSTVLSQETGRQLNGGCWSISYKQDSEIDQPVHNIHNSYYCIYICNTNHVRNYMHKVQCTLLSSKITALYLQFTSSDTWEKHVSMAWYQWWQDTLMCSEFLPDQKEKMNHVIGQMVWCLTLECSEPY